MSAPELVVHPDDDTTAADAADRLISALATAQAARGTASIVLTGGGVGIAMLQEVARSPRRAEVAWPSVEVFWGDERYLPAGDDERNDTQAREALLDDLDLDPGRVHPMPPSDAPEEAGGGDPDLAADVYATVLSEAASRLGGEGVPIFDVLLAGCGPEGHVLSVFPDSPAVHAQAVGVLAVRDCPKPPPTRVTLTLAAARQAREIWLRRHRGGQGRGPRPRPRRRERGRRPDRGAAGDRAHDLAARHRGRGRPPGVNAGQARAS